MATSLSTVSFSPPLSAEEIDVQGRTNQTTPPDISISHPFFHNPATPVTYKNKLTQGNQNPTFTHQELPLFTKHLMPETNNPKEGRQKTYLPEMDKCIDCQSLWEDSWI